MNEREKAVRRIRETMKREVLCGLARQNCIMVLQARAVLDYELIARTCSYISTLCRDHGDEACLAQSQTCAEAAQALTAGDEARYLELCQQACVTCPYSEEDSVPETATLQ